MIGAAAAAAIGLGAPARAEDSSPRLSLDPIVAGDLLSPIAEQRGREYRPGLTTPQASGQRAKLSLDIGQSTLFAITGRLTRRSVVAGPLDPDHARALGYQPRGGKVYGAGLVRNVGGIELSATYQYSKIRPLQSDASSEAGTYGPGKSHSLQTTARIRFRP